MDSRRFGNILEAYAYHDDLRWRNFWCPMIKLLGGVFHKYSHCLNTKAVGKRFTLKWIDDPRLQDADTGRVVRFVL